MSGRIDVFAAELGHGVNVNGSRFGELYTSDNFPYSTLEKRYKIIDDINADVATDKTAVLTAELITYTFAVAAHYRHFSITFLADESGTASDVNSVGFTFNAASAAIAAGILSVDEGDADSQADYIPRNVTVEGAVSEDIFRLDMTGIFGSGGVALAQDTILVRIW